MYFTELLDELKNKPYFEDIGIHIIKGDFLHPFWKMSSTITIEEWKSFHSKNKMRTEEDKYLSEMVKTGQEIFVDEVKETDPECLLNFGIKSTNLIPIKDNEKVIGFVTMPVFSKYYTYSNKDKEEIIEIIGRHKENIKEIILWTEQ